MLACAISPVISISSTVDVIKTGKGALLLSLMLSGRHYLQVALISLQENKEFLCLCKLKIHTQNLLVGYNTCNLI